MRGRAAAVVALSAVLAGCGGGGGSSPAPLLGSNGTTQQIGSGVSGTLTLTVANGTGPSANKRAPQFVSPGALSASVSINNGTATYADVSASSSLCTTAAGVRTCAITVGAPAGQASFAVSLYDAASGGGHLLGSGSNSTTVTAGTPFTVNVGINPVVASMQGTSNIQSFTVGTASSATITPVFVDPAGQQITGSGNVPNFLYPVTLTASDPHVSVTPSTLTTPGQSYKITYDGSASAASSVAVTVKANGASVFSGTVSIPGLAVTRCNFSPQTQGSNIPAQITVGPDNKIWFADTTTNKLGQINPATGCSSMTFFSNALGTGAPYGIAAGGDGNIWYSNGGQLIGRMTTSGTAPATGPASISVGASGSQVYQLATDSQGNVWFLNSGLSIVGYVDKNTFAVNTFGATPTANAVKSSSAIALGSDNAMWFTEPFTTPRSQIGRITTPANGTAGTYVETGINGTTGSSAFPFDIASGPDGNIWLPVFASNATNQFFAYFAPAASVASIFEFANVINPNLFANLVTMFKGGDNNMWIAEGGGGVKIVPSNPNGAQVEVFTDNGQTTMIKCIAGPDGNNWCTVYGSAPLGQGFINTYDGVLYWTPR